MATAIVSPTLPANGNGQSACPTHKKIFLNRADAEQFEEKNREKYGNAQQYAYACEQCPGFHLSYQSPESHGMQTSRAAVVPADGKRGRLTNEVLSQRYGSVRKLLAENPAATRTEMSVKLAAEWGCPANAAYQFLTNHKAHIESGADPTRGKWGRPAVSTLVTLDTLAAKRKALEAQLAALQAEEQKLIEAKRIKLLPCWDGEGVLISQEGNKFGLKLADVQELIEKLTEFITNPQ